MGSPQQTAPTRRRHLVQHMPPRTRQRPERKRLLLPSLLRRLRQEPAMSIINVPRGERVSANTPSPRPGVNAETYIPLNGTTSVHLHICLGRRDQGVSAFTRSPLPTTPQAPLCTQC